MHILLSETHIFLNLWNGENDPRKYFFNNLFERILPDWAGSYVCVEVLWPNQPNGVMSSVVSLPNHFYWAGLVL